MSNNNNWRYYTDNEIVFVANASYSFSVYLYYDFEPNTIVRKKLKLLTFRSFSFATRTTLHARIPLKKTHTHSSISVFE